MTETENKNSSVTADYREKLIVAIYPGVGEECVTKGFEFGKYNLNMKVKDLVDVALSECDQQDKSAADRIRRELESKGKIVAGNIVAENDSIGKYVTVNETPDKQTKYLYLELRAIKPQEAGKQLKQTYIRL